MNPSTAEKKSFPSASFNNNNKLVSTNIKPQIPRYKTKQKGDFQKAFDCSRKQDTDLF